MTLFRSGRRISAALVFAGAASTAIARDNAPAPVHRTDLPAAFSAAVCSGEATGAIPFKEWSTGVHDAQLEGRMLTRGDGLDIDLDRLEHAARALASLRGAGGYAFGRCGPGKGWALALPAPAPLTADAQGRLLLPRKDLSERCASWRADFAPRDQGAPRQLAPEHGAIAVAKLGDGVVSLTCQPPTPRWRGPLMWYMIPVGRGPAESAPIVDALPAASERLAPDVALTPWINRLRAREGLDPIVANTEMTTQASLLSVDGSLTHDRLLQQRASSALATGHVKLLGEDRVKAKDAQTMAWLLWNSPRHRELLLAKDASVVGIAARPTGDEQLVVIITGSTTPLKTATGPKPRRQPATSTP